MVKLLEWVQKNVARCYPFFKSSIRPCVHWEMGRQSYDTPRFNEICKSCEVVLPNVVLEINNLPDVLFVVVKADRTSDG